MQTWGQSTVLFATACTAEVVYGKNMGAWKLYCWFKCSDLGSDSFNAGQVSYPYWWAEVL